MVLCCHLGGERQLTPVHEGPRITLHRSCSHAVIPGPGLPFPVLYRCVLWVCILPQTGFPHEPRDFPCGDRSRLVRCVFARTPHYAVEIPELVSLGQVRPSKSADTLVYLFAVDVTAKRQHVAQGDGSCLEKNASVKWVHYEQGVHINDPLFVTALARLQCLKMYRHRE